MTQASKLGKLLQRRQGVTMFEVCIVCGSVTPSRRLSDLRDAGWIITKKKVEGKNYHRFYGKPPKKQQMKGLV